MNRQRSVSAAVITALLAAWVLLSAGDVLHDLTPHHPWETGAASCSICKTSEGHCAYPVPGFTVQAPAAVSGLVVVMRSAERIPRDEHAVASPRAPPLPA
jgi:hypothetical protein